MFADTSFEIKKTNYGGRACFARESMKKGTTLLALDSWLGSSISHEFRKEVCHYCLEYDSGKTMKIKIDWDDVGCESELNEGINSKNYKGSGVWFCSEECKILYLQQPDIKELLLSYEIILNNFQRSRKKETGPTIQSERDDTVAGKSDIDIKWDFINHEWIPMILNMKLSKALNYLPIVEEEHYSCMRFVIESVITISHLEDESVKKKAFYCLQSNEVDKIKKFPVLLDFQMKVFQTLFILFPTLRTLLTTDLFRHILGSEYGNSFGIWQISESSDDREYLGYMVHPEASYFNHSCSPNVEKKRVGRTMYYSLAEDVRPGQQLCIDYKGILHLDAKKRQAILKDNWFFECMCDRCTLELQSIH